MTSRTTVLAVVLGLVLIAFTVVAGSIVLVAMDKQVPDSLVAIGAGASGALAGVLASTRSTLGPNDTEPQTMVATVTPTIVPRVLAPGEMLVEGAHQAGAVDGGPGRNDRV